MRKLSIKSPFEHIAVEIGGTEVALRVDCTDSSIDRTAARLIGAQDEVNALIGDLSGAGETAETHRRLAGIIADAVVPAIGRDSYEELLAACGEGERLAPEECNVVMVQVFAEIAAAVVERLSAVKEGKAAHYLQAAAE